MTENYSMPVGEAAKETKGEFAPLLADDYIVKVAAIDLEKKPSWNAATGKPNYSQLEFKYSLICLPYKLKAEDGLKYTNGKDAKPLSSRIWKDLSPFSMGTKDGKPSLFRSFVAYAQGLASADANTQIPIPGIIVLNKEEEIATDEETKMYKEQFKNFIENKDTAGFTMKNEGFKHISDIKSLEGKYVGVRLEIDRKGKNSIVGFSKLPSNFTPDASVETEAMLKFADRYQNMMYKRQDKKSAEVVEVDHSSLPF